MDVFGPQAGSAPQYDFLISEQPLDMPVIPEWMATPILAFCVAALLMPLLSRVAIATGFVDIPNARKIHTAPIPLLGGLAVYAGVVTTLLLRGSLDHRIYLILGASLLVILLGVLDDRMDLHSRYRLLLQVGVALGLSLLGVRLHLTGWEIGDHILTVALVVGTINAMNCLDCADGTAGGTCLVSFLVLSVLAAASGRGFVCQAALAGMGAVLGFLLYNLPPARVFLGDTGSTFLGLMVAVLAVLATPTVLHQPTIPLGVLVLFVPVYDIVLVHIRRYRAGIRSIRDLLSSTGKDHLPHRLMARGLGKLPSMLVVTFLTALSGVGALGLNQGWWVVSIMCFACLGAFLWHIEERGEVVIREGDQVALFRFENESHLVAASLQTEEGVA